jgi:16S rRNA (cytidine1402-2'-O)-methyltransferase
MLAAQAPVGGLVVCPTPIGNLEDVTLRVLRALSEADLVACEDTRRTRVLLERHGIDPRLVSYHARNERQRASELVRRMRGGEHVALVSDAGTPLLSDPGAELLRAALAAELPVEVLPGPSAAITALVASGLPAGRFCFAGFLPRARAEVEHLLGEARETLVVYESPRRLPATLELLAALEPGRRAAVCRELTKLHEEVRRDTLAALAAHYRANPPRGEVVLVLAPGADDDQDAAAAEGALSAVRELVAAGARPRAAAATVGRLTGVRANDLYRGLTAQ